MSVFWIYGDVHVFTLSKSTPRLERKEVLDNAINFRDRWFEAKSCEPKTQKSL